MTIPKPTCKLCNKPVSDKSSIKCNFCSQVSHYKCNYLTSVDSHLIKNFNENWQCLHCSRNMFPFVELHDYKFNIATGNKIDYTANNDKLSFKTPPNLSELYNQFNNLSSNNEDSDDLVNCKYYNIEEMSNLKDSINNNSLSLFHLNISSLNKHIDNLEHLLTTSNVNFDVIGISETRITDSSSASKLKLNDYSQEFCPTESNAGGTAIYVKNSRPYKPRHDLNIHKPHHLESTFIELINPKKTNVIIGCIYRHPNMELNEFNEDYLNVLLHKISKENKSVFLLGDFNVDLLKYDKHNATNEFLDSLSSSFFLPTILLPTRNVGSSRTLIDNIFSNYVSHEIISGNICASISDHLPQFCLIPNIYANSIPSKSNVYERNWSDFNKENFILDFFAADWTTALNVGYEDVNYSFECFLKMFNVLLDKYAPFKKVTKQQIKFKSKPWITAALQKSIEIKNVFFTKYIKSKHQNIKDIFHDKYKRYRNLLSTLLKQSKKNYYNDYFNINISNIKNTWKGISSIISNSNNTLNAPSCLSYNNSFITNPQEVANVFNNYFCSIAKNVHSQIKFSFRDFQFYLGNAFEKTFFTTPTDNLEVSDIIATLSINKSQGPNGIPTRILLMLKHDIAPILADLFNISFSSGVFPSILKIAKVIPVHKKHSRLDCNNYRPISILSNLDKILEKLMYNRLYRFLEDNELIYPLQFGFRKSYSTSLALLSLTENIKQEIDDGKFGCGIFIDFQKAFDTVDHNILINKLQHYGIRGIANDWFKSYLTDRKQFVSINGFNSDLEFNNCGVPQGSILGPLLFLIYINDLHNSIKFCKTHHFADDTNLLYFNKSAKQLNKHVNYDLKHIVNWLNANKICLNVSKTELVVFKPLKKSLDHDLCIKLNGKRLYPTSSVKYLGVRIDSNLNWKEHLNATAIKLNKANAILSKVRHYVNESTLKSIYYAIFESHFNYASIVWAQKMNSSNRLF